MTEFVEHIPTGVAKAASGVSVDVCFDFATVRPQWAAMNDPALPFQTLAWLEPWYRILAPALGVRPVFATVRDEDGRPLLFFPLCLRRWRGLRVIEFADLGVSDYNGPLVARGFEPTPDELDALWRRVRRALPPSDLVRLEKIPDSILGRANVFARLRGLRTMHMSAWMLELPETPRDYDESLSVKLRRENRRTMRRLQEAVGEFTLEPAQTADAAEAMLAVLRRQRTERFGDDNLLEHPHFHAFYHEVIMRNLNGFAELWALKAGDRVLAAQFAVRGPRAHLMIMKGFDATLNCGSTGILALDQIIRRRIELGDRHFDFTIGDENYKRQFGVKRVRLHKACYPTSPLGWVYVVAHGAAKRIRDAWRAARHAAALNRRAAPLTKPSHPPRPSAPG